MGSQVVTLFVCHDIILQAKYNVSFLCTKPLSLRLLQQVLIHGSTISFLKPYLDLQIN